jgi:hypothetical protein
MITNLLHIHLIASIAAAKRIAHHPDTAARTITLIAS